MRSSSDLLIKLVATMSRQEKRYFRLYSRFYTKEQGNNVLKLFEAIERIKPSSGAALATAVADEPYARHLSILKKQLVEQILDSLLSYGSPKTYHTLQRQIMHADVLSDRGLYSHAAQTLARTEKKALQTEEHLLVMEVLYRQRSLLFKEVAPEFEENIHDLYARGRTILTKILSTSTYRETVDLMQVIATRYAARPTKADREKMDIMVAALLESNIEHMSFTDKLTHHNILGTYTLLVNDTAAALGHYRTIVQLWKQHELIAEKKPQQYPRYLLNYLNCLVTEGTAEEFAAVAQEIRDKLATSEADSQILLNLWNLEMLFYMNRGDLDACETVVAEVVNYLPLHIDAVDATTLFSLYHNCSIHYFLTGQYSRCLEYINLLQSESRVAIKQDVHAFSRVFSVVAHYELGNVDILDNMIRSAKRYLKKNSASGAFEKTVMSGIRALVVAVDKKEKASAFRALHRSLVGILHSSANEPLGITELLFWTQSCLDSRSIRELFIQKIREAPQPDARVLFPT